MSLGVSIKEIGTHVQLLLSILELESFSGGYEFVYIDIFNVHD